MLKGMFYPYTPTGESSLLPDMPWHYAGYTIAAEFEADPEKAASLLPEGWEPSKDGRCTLFVFEWQTAAGSGKGYLDPARSQYKEAFLLIEAGFRGRRVGFCPFIWVDNDLALMRGLLQGYPKQLGSVHMTRVYPVPGQASPAYAPGGQFAGCCSAKDHRLLDLQVTLEKKSDRAPFPGPADVLNRMVLPDLRADRLGQPLIDYYVTKSLIPSAEMSEIWTGSADIQIHDDYYPELGLLKPVKTLGGYAFSMAFTLTGMEYEERV